MFQIGLYAVNYLDLFIRQISPYIIVLLECCLLMYIFGARRVVRNIEDMTGHKISPWWTFNWKFLSPVLLLVISSKL